MVYRAKITKIQDWVEEHYDIDAYTIVRDVKDVYIEINRQDEADYLELMNKKKEELLLLQSQWYSKFE